jgi:catalase
MSNNHDATKQRPPITTTDAGIPAPCDECSLTAGPGGPVLLQDNYLIEKMAHFNRERVPERVVHAKGGGAFGYFEVTADVTPWTKAAFLNTVGKRTPPAHPLLDGGRRAGLCGYGPRPARLRPEVLHRRRQL